MALNFDALRLFVEQKLTQQSSADRITGVEVRAATDSIINMVESVMNLSIHTGEIIASLSELDLVIDSSIRGVHITSGNPHPILGADFSVITSQETSSTILQLAWGIINNSLKVLSRRGLSEGSSWEAWLEVTQDLTDRVTELEGNTIRFVSVSIEDIDDFSASEYGRIPGQYQVTLITSFYGETEVTVEVLASSSNELTFTHRVTLQQGNEYVRDVFWNGTNGGFGSFGKWTEVIQTYDAGTFATINDFCSSNYGKTPGQYFVILTTPFYSEFQIVIEVLRFSGNISSYGQEFIYRATVVSGEFFTAHSLWFSGVFHHVSDWIKETVDAEVVHLAGDETITGGKAFSKGAVFYGQVSPFPTGIGSYVAHYLSTAYNICRSLAYNGVAYVDYALGAFIAAKNKFSLVLKADGKAEFGSSVSIDGQLSTSTFVLNGITYDASSFKGRYDAETVSAPANAGTLTLKNATETVISTTLTNSNSFTIALPTAIASKVNESILIFKTGATLPTLTQPSGIVYRTETPVIAINQTWTFCYERVSYDNGLTFETYVSATKNV